MKIEFEVFEKTFKRLEPGGPVRQIVVLAPKAADGLVAGNLTLVYEQAKQVPYDAGDHWTVNITYDGPVPPAPTKKAASK